MFSRIARSPIRNHALIVRFASTHPLNFDKILIANRGEIACRVIKTAKEMGIKTVAVYSDADKNSMHVKMADEAFNIGPAPSQQSYLNVPRILEVAKESGAKAVHPGYGFLSENASFAEECTRQGIEFIGPPPSAIVKMGSKSESKDIMNAAKVPCVGGYHGTNQDPKFLEEEADKIGYPVLIKAVAGGGGKGMRIVETKELFQEMLESAKREATKSFGEDRVLVEKYLVNPRHVEVQVFADKHGDCVYLFERDCSIQRRHQKIIEEAPAPGLSEETRKELGEAAVAAALAVDYVGAGTVEFIMDQSQKFFFMEMNTRLQVEHPVTEYITGTDLVEWQLKVASGEPLPQKQHELKRKGHSFEARIYAEDPDNDFLPVTGKLHYLRPPPTSENVRIDTGVRQNDEVSVFYDPMIAKLIVWGEDRQSALRRLVSNLGQYQVAGLRTNIEMVSTIAQHPAFIAGEVETGFIDKYKDDILKKNKTINHHVVAQAVVGKLLAESLSSSRSPFSRDLIAPWLGNSYRTNNNMTETSQFKVTGQEVTAVVTHLPENAYDVSVESESGESKSFHVEDVRFNGNRLSACFNGHKRDAVMVFSENEISVFDQTGQQSVIEVPQPKFLQREIVEDAFSIHSPMTGKVEKILFKVGDKVTAGTPVAIVEAMKMEHVLKAAVDGVIATVNHSSGDIVNQHDLLVKIDPQ